VEAAHKSGDPTEIPEPSGAARPSLPTATTSGTSSTAPRPLQPTELHLFADTDHFMFAESNTRVRRIDQDWLAASFEVDAQSAAA
jgi:hypothetical protein